MKTLLAGLLLAAFMLPAFGHAHVASIDELTAAASETEHGVKRRMALRPPLPLSLPAATRTEAEASQCHFMSDWTKVFSDLALEHLATRTPTELVTCIEEGRVGALNDDGTLSPDSVPVQGLIYGLVDGSSDSFRSPLDLRESYLTRIITKENMLAVAEAARMRAAGYSAEENAGFVYGGRVHNLFFFLRVGYESQAEFPALFNGISAYDKADIRDAANLALALRVLVRPLRVIGA